MLSFGNLSIKGKRSKKRKSRRNQPRRDNVSDIRSMKNSPKNWGDSSPWKIQQLSSNSQTTISKRERRLILYNSKKQWHRVNILRRKSSAQSKEALSKDGLEWNESVSFLSHRICVASSAGCFEFPGKIGVNYLKDAFNAFLIYKIAFHRESDC